MAGDLLIDPALKHSTMDKVVEHVQHCIQKNELPFTWTAVDHIWSNTPDKCALRKCVVDYFYAHTGEYGFTEKASSINAHFLYDLCNRAFEIGHSLPSERGPYFRYMERPFCRYHDHKDEEQCESGTDGHPWD